MKKLVLFFVMSLLALVSASQTLSAQGGGLSASDFNLCIVGGEAINNYPIFDHVLGEDSVIILTISTQPEGFDISINPDQSIKVVATTAFTGAVSIGTYTVCNAMGFCDSATITITYADIESITLPQPQIIPISTLNTLSTQICSSDIGWILQNNCIPNLFTVCLTHNENLGTLTYINNQCANYVPTGMAGVDTIRIMSCGDAPPPTFYTCDGPVTMSNCSEVWYIVTISSTSTGNTFTETHDITCAEIAFIEGLGFPTWATATIVEPAQHGIAEIIEGDAFQYMEYTPYPGFLGVDTVVVACAHATQLTCDTGIYVFNVSCDPSMYWHLNKSAICGTTANLGDYVGSWGFAPYIFEQPAHGIATVLGFTVFYTPNFGFTGTDTLYVGNVSGGPADEAINAIFVIDVDCDNAVPTINNPNGLTMTYLPEKRLATLSVENGVFEQVSLFDLAGRKIEQSTLFDTPQTATLSFDRLPAGIYLLGVQCNKTAQTFKILVK